MNDAGRRVARLGMRVLLAAQLVLSLAGIFVLARAVQGIPVITVVHGASMEPGLSQGDAYYCATGWDVGDVVVLQDPTRDRLLVKRAVAVGPCSIWIDPDGNLMVDGYLIEEPYIRGCDPEKAGFWDVPEGYVFVLGDNRSVSMDSRDFGPVPCGHVKCHTALYIGHCDRLEEVD